MGPYFMLRAFSFENLLKARIVRLNFVELQTSFEETKQFLKILKDHSLVKLAKRAEVPIDFEEEDLLRRLTRNAVWAGRYPTPLKYQETSGKEQFNDGKQYCVSWFGGDDIDRLNALYSKLVALVEADGA
jgi:hypothetical protein